MAAVSLFWNTNMAAVTSVSDIRKKKSKTKNKKCAKPRENENSHSAILDFGRRGSATQSPCGQLIG